jgi:predicted dehydrogenase
MKFLVIGLGSMGKRRIRCLKALEYFDITGFDNNKDRTNEAKDKYQINVINSLDDIDFKKFNAVIISTPPDIHTKFAKIAIENNLPCFIEASVVLNEVNELKNFNSKNIFIAPSCTLKFHPVIKQFKEIITSKKFGKITNFSYHSGQYLPDWHPWENVKDYYVSNRITGGAREIVPFELTWLCDLVGFPIKCNGVFNKTIDCHADIEDSYSLSLKYHDKVGNMIVDVASRFATRSVIINFELAQIRWNWEDNFYKIFEVSKNSWDIYNIIKTNHEDGYNPNIIEEMYIDEIKSFIEGIKDPNNFPNNLEDDLRILKILEEVENSDGGFNK